MAGHADITGVELHQFAQTQPGDPGAIGAGKGWIDTSLGAGRWVLKVRNAGNSGWEDVFGTSVNPSATFRTVAGVSYYKHPVTGLWHSVIPVVDNNTMMLTLSDVGVAVI